MAARLTRIGAKAMTLAATLALTACLAWRVTLTPGPLPLDTPLNTIALAPGDGLFADLIGLALAERGYAIVDTGMAQALLVVLREREEDVLTPRVMTGFQQRGIDAVLTVQWVERPDGVPQQATAQLYSTRDAAMICRVEWRQGWRLRGPVEAAQEVAETLLRCLARAAEGA
jgi:hypothetical protein